MAQPDRRIAGIINPLEFMSQLPQPGLKWIYKIRIYRRPRGLNGHFKGQLTAPRASRLHAAAAPAYGSSGLSRVAL
jgi:hypothetical protein